jgi:hypothetical protein
MVQTKSFEIVAFTPQFLLLLRFVDEAREDLRRAESHRDVLRYRNERRTEELAAAEGPVVQAQERLGDAEQALIAVKDDASFDVRDACRRAGVRYAWWPVDLYVDPRLHRYRGQPLTPEEVDEIGPLRLTRLINAGAIVVAAEMVPPGGR